jgi:hypothetical protein
MENNHPSAILLKWLGDQFFFWGGGTGKSLGVLMGHASQLLVYDGLSKIAK